MRRFAVIMLSLLVFTMGFVSIIEGQSIRSVVIPNGVSSVWLQLLILLAPPIVLLFLGAFLLVWGAQGNVYRIRKGEVIGHRFTAASLILIPTATPGVTTQHWIPKTWSVKVRAGNGRTQWFDFASEDAFAEYPVGSQFEK